MKREITITRQEFHETFCTLTAELTSDPFDALKFTILYTKAEMEFFSGEDDNTEAPFKSGDAVFVIDNEDDNNCFVNRVVTVVKVYDKDNCEVTDGERVQMIYFKNLRKVTTS